MQVAEIKKLIKMLENTEIAEVEIHQGNESVRIRLSPHQSLSKVEKQKNHEIINIATSTEDIQRSIKASTQEILGSDKTAENKHVVKASMVGKVSLALESGGKPFVEVGQNIKTGDILCIIHVMNMPNTIEADKSGKVLERHVDEGTKVEYGQPLFTIEQE